MSGSFERLAEDVIGTQPGEQPWHQTVGSMPQGQLAQAASQALQQVSSQDYHNHTQPGVSGTDPFGTLAGPQLQGLAQTLLSALFNQGVSQQQVQQTTGLSSLDPSKISPQELAALAQWMQRSHPQALGQAASQYQNQPDILARLLGNKALLALGAQVGANVLTRRSGSGGFTGSGGSHA